MVARSTSRGRLRGPDRSIVPVQYGDAEFARGTGTAFGGIAAGEGAAIWVTRKSFGDGYDAGVDSSEG